MFAEICGFNRIPCELCSRLPTCTRAYCELTGTTSTQDTRVFDDYEKKPLKKYHCRICGHIYWNKSESKECERSHSWQNKRGRR